MERLEIEQWQHVVGSPCECSGQIPGLDAIGCRKCKTWWIDKDFAFKAATTLDRKRKK